MRVPPPHFDRVWVGQVVRPPNQRQAIPRERNDTAVQPIRPELTEVPPDTHKPCRKTSASAFSHILPIRHRFPPKAAWVFRSNPASIWTIRESPVSRHTRPTASTASICRMPGLIGFRASPFQLCPLMRTRRPLRQFRPGAPADRVRSRIPLHWRHIPKCLLSEIAEIDSGVGSAHS